jgi:hypothetical protein
LADPGSSRVDPQVRAGAAYYFVVELNLAPVRTNPLAAYALSPLDPQTGAARLGQLKAAQNQQESAVVNSRLGPRD